MFGDVLGTCENELGEDEWIDEIVVGGASYVVVRHTASKSARMRLPTHDSCPDLAINV